MRGESLHRLSGTYEAAVAAAIQEEKWLIVSLIGAVGVDGGMEQEREAESLRASGGEAKCYQRIPDERVVVGAVDGNSI
jgi:hypothetical protein